MEKLDRSDSSLFLVRLPRGRDGGSSEWQGSVVSVSDGASRTFSDWQMLIEVLLEMQEQHEGSNPDRPGQANVKGV